MGAIVLDDDLAVRGEVIFDLEIRLGRRMVEGGMNSLPDRTEFLQYGLFVTGADSDKEVGLTEEGEAKLPMVDAFGEFVLPGEDVGEMKAAPAGWVWKNAIFSLIGRVILSFQAGWKCLRSSLDLSMQMKRPARRRSGMEGAGAPGAVGAPGEVEGPGVARRL